MMKDVSEREFNEYCAKVMGYEIRKVYAKGDLACYKGAGSYFAFDPYNDLNQMAEVVEKLTEPCPDNAMRRVLLRTISNDCFTGGIKQAFLDFIISTMPEKEDANNSDDTCPFCTKPQCLNQCEKEK
jgi:hypothetical protein